MLVLGNLKHSHQRYCWQGVVIIIFMMLCAQSSAQNGLLALPVAPAALYSVESDTWSGDYSSHGFLWQRLIYANRTTANSHSISPRQNILLPDVDVNAVLQ